MENLLQILANFSLLVDAGLVVLIWMVQLIIYPSFLYYEQKNLIEWHQKYTSRIAVIVVPLMSFQLIFSLFTTFYNPVLNNYFHLISVLLLWIITFIWFAPIHLKISDGIVTTKMLNRLIYRNWLRTFLWTFVLILNLFNS